jgi:hypothetical protein
LASTLHGRENSNMTYMEAISDGFRIAVHPAARAGATFQVAIKSG